MSELFQATELKVPLYQDFLPIVLSYIENTAKVFKLDPQSTTQLVLATEEIFSFLTYNAKQAETLYLTTKTKGSYIEVIAKFALETLPVEAMNLTTKISTDDYDDLGAMGLLIAARSVDSLRLDIDNDGYMYLCCTKNKQYNRLPPSLEVPTEFSGNYYAEDIDIDRIPEFCAQAVAAYGGSDVVEFLHYPQKLSDIITKGDYDGCFALDSDNRIAGGLFWKSDGDLLKGKGFFIFAQKDKEEVTKILMSGCHSRTSILKPHGLFIGNTTMDTPLDFLRVGRSAAYHPMYGGDKPICVYINSSLMTFAHNFYRKLGIIRNLYEQMSGEISEDIASKKSAFAVSINKFYKRVKMSALWIGQDALESLQNHIDVLRDEGLSYIVFDLAMERPEQAIMGEFLLQAGFKPEVILPWTNEGDILRFYYNLVTPQ